MDLFGLIAAERRRLADAMEQLDDAQWQHDSLCAGWNAHVVAAHLNVPWAVPRTHLVATWARNLGNIGKTIDVCSRELAEQMDPAACLAMYREHEADRYQLPTVGPHAPLTDTVVHGADLLAPLGRSVDVAPDALIEVMTFVTSAKAKRGFRSMSLDGLAFRATDLGGETFGTGSGLVEGPAINLVGAILGRPHHVAQLSGDGLARLRSRL